MKYLFMESTRIFRQTGLIYSLFLKVTEISIQTSNNKLKSTIYLLPL